MPLSSEQIESTSIPIPEDSDNTRSLDESSESSTHYFFTNVLNPKKYIFPLTLKRVFVWLVTGSIIYLMFYLLHDLNGLRAIESFMGENFLWLNIIAFGLDPLMTILQWGFSRFPNSLQTPLSAEVINDECIETEEALENEIEDIDWPSLVKKTGLSASTLKIRYKKNKALMVMIPCHNTCSDESGKRRFHEVLVSALKHVPAKNIRIVDNGRNTHPTDDTEALVESVDSNISYAYYPNPSKTTAQFKALVNELKNPSGIKYVLTFDDDVCIPDNFIFHKSLFKDPLVECIAFPIRAVAPNGKKSLLISWQDIDYIRAAMQKGFESATGTVRAVHGAVSLWNIRAFYKALKDHDADFYGEDRQLTHRYSLTPNPQGVPKTKLDSSCFFSTDVPTQFFAPDGRWPQQVRSWMKVPFLRISEFFLSPLFLFHKANSVSGYISTKLIQIYDIISIFNNAFRIPIIALQASNPKFWIVLGIITGVDMLATTIHNFVLLPKYLKNDLKSVLTYSLIHKHVDNILQFFTLLRVLFIELPVLKSHKSIHELIEAGLLPSLDDELSNSRIIEQADNRINLEHSLSSSSSIRAALKALQEEVTVLRAMITRTNEDINEDEESSNGDNNEDLSTIESMHRSDVVITINEEDSTHDATNIPRDIAIPQAESHTIDLDRSPVTRHQHLYHQRVPNIFFNSQDVMEWDNTMDDGMVPSSAHRWTALV